ncbi:MAG: NAD(P)-binding protein [Pseudomonadota bacterium]
MTSRKRQLGMHRAISRRDFVHGAAALAGTTIMAGTGFATNHAQLSSNAYPPARTGLRGNHPGSFDVAHKLGREGVTAWGAIEDAAEGAYDLIIVGAGISGLAAAWFYTQDHKDARILILDNHDDFGGHAKRNEFVVDGKTLIGYGGSQTLQEPSKYSRQAKRLLKGLGINLKRFDSAYDQSFYKRNGIGPGLYFDADVWGKRAMVPYNMGTFDDYIPIGPNGVGPAEAARMMPISPPAQAQMARLLTLKSDQLSDLSEDEKYEYLYEASYRDFLTEAMGITEPEVFKVLQNLFGDAGVGIEAVSAFSALSYGGLPGWEAAGLGDAEPFENYIHHFPDGNASIARLMVRALIPGVAPGWTKRTKAEQIVTTKLDYSQLDLADAPVQLRLEATAVNVANTASGVAVTYVKDGQAIRAKAARCILACNHSIVPYLCPELSDEQRDAFAFPERVPILYNTIAIRHWQAFKNIGIGAVYAPGSYHIHATLDFPVSIGGYKYPDDPSQPALVHMERFPHVNNEGLSKREQCRAGRYELLGTPFEDIEYNIRAQLAGILGPGGFDPAEDIAAITVNRWAHGYAYSYSDLFDDTYEDWNDPRMPHVIARQPIGRITVANSDSAAIALLDNAVDEAHRAVQELERI